MTFAALLAASQARAGMVEEIDAAEAIFAQPWHVSGPGIDPVRVASVSQTGKASWYGRTGHRTANGERYPTDEPTCAHRTLPFGTKVRVTRLDDGRSVRCRVNDRGPFVHNRVIDLSPRAALGLGMIGAGVVRVRVEVLN
jgi:rare lipoprotein A